MHMAGQTGVEIQDQAVLCIPHADPTGIFWSMQDGRVRLANDPRELYQPGMSLDPRAVFSLLQFSAVIPPLTPWREVSRLVPGYRYRVTADSAPVQMGPLPLFQPQRMDNLSPEEQTNLVEALLDQTLVQAARPAVLFSGGTDSGLLAARLAALGRKDTLLINYSFGALDPESRLAESMAAHLGLQFERITDDPADLTKFLERPGEVYPFPFSDQSTGPMEALVLAAIRRLGGHEHTVFDGTGAGYAFGEGRRIADWQRLFRIPRPIRKLAGSAYIHFWRRSGAVESYLRILRRSVQMRFVSAVLAHNPLAGLLYGRTGEAEVHSLLDEWVGNWPIVSVAQQVVAGALAMSSANTYAQKVRPLFQRSGMEVRFPFLSFELVGLGIHATDAWAMDEPKAPLKRLLARSVPPSMVYRPKSAFGDPARRIFRSKAFIECLLDATTRGAPLEEYLLHQRVRQAAGLLRGGAEFPVQTLNCLWAIVFLDRWMRTVKSIRTAGVSAGSIAP